MPKCENFDLLFFKLINHIWVGDRRTGFFLFIVKTEADIRHFIFITHADCALNNGLRTLSVRKKRFAHAECAIKKVYAR